MKRGGWIIGIAAAAFLTLIVLLLMSPPQGQDGTKKHAPGEGAVKRIITFAPSITETAFALGAGDRVVGVSRWCLYPEEAQDKKKCGGAINPNYEAMLSLAPDLIIVLGQARKVSGFGVAHDIEVMRVTMNSVAEIREDITRIGKRVGREAEALEICSKIDSDLAAIRVERPEAERPRVFISLSRPSGAIGSLMTAGGDTFINEMIQIAGGVNVFADRKLYPTVSKETLIRLEPDVILELRPEEEMNAERRKQIHADWAPLASLPAVREGRIAIVTDGRMQHPGPRVAEIARLIRDALENTKAKNPAE